MYCPNNPKIVKHRFLFWKWETKDTRHKMKIVLAEWSDFLACWTILRECKYCGLQQRLNFIEDQEILNIGGKLPTGDRQDLYEGDIFFGGKDGK